MLAELLEALRPQVADRAVETLIIDNCPDGSAQATVEGCNDPAVRYIHEPRSGVVYARNRGVIEAKGAYIIFLDDDEVPHAGWLDAFLSQADGVTDMSFGRIVPRLLAPCSSGLAGQIERAFSREMKGSTGTDISSFSAYLGTGNAMFNKARCFADAAPFDPRFNARGGEDVWLIQTLVRMGHKPLWNREALVDELVPEDRTTLTFMKARRFNQGQLRCILMHGDGGVNGAFKVAIWMMVGAIQLGLFGLAALITARLSPDRSEDLQCRASGGAGKLLWWRSPTLGNYSQD